MSGYEFFQGSFYQIKKFLYKDTKSKVILAQEFGTKPSILVFRAMMIENAAYSYGDESDKLAGAKLIKDAFYVQKNYWKKEIVERGKLLFFKCLKDKSLQGKGN